MTAQTTEQLFALTLDECVDAIKATASKVTVLVQGHAGTGKSSMLKVLAKDLPNHIPCYLDMSCLDLGDIMLPKVLSADNHTNYVSFAPNESIGIHHGKPVILMLDEFGKANPSVKNAVMRLMLERKLGEHALHPDSLVFATTNLGSEGLGDLLQPHHRNRITTIRMKKPSPVEWIEGFAINAGIHPAVIRWVHEFGDTLFATFEEVSDPESNPYIYHPKSVRASFVTPRSLELASHWLHAKDNISKATLKQALMGTIGARGGADLEAYIAIHDQLPKKKEIMSDPLGAKIPNNASATMMLVTNALIGMDREFVSPWMQYMSRLDTEAQGYFVMQVRNPKYDKKGMVMTNKDYTAWCMANNFLFTSDV